MKKLLLLFLLAPNLYAARACVKVIEDIDGHTDPPNSASVRWDLKVAYQGTDVPGLTQKGVVSIVVSTTTTALQIQTAIVSAVQAEATSRGFTVPAGGTLMPTFSFQ